MDKLGRPLNSDMCSSHCLAVSMKRNLIRWELLHIRNWCVASDKRFYWGWDFAMYIIELYVSSLFVAISYNQPRFCSNASWNPNATTLANSSIVGNIPHAVFVNTMNTVFVANRDTGNVLIWSNGSLSVTSTILASVTTPSVLFVTGDDQIFLDNQLSVAQVDRWTLNQTKLVSPMIVCSYCSGLFVDINSNLYCSHHDRDQVLRKSLNNSTNTSVIIAGIGWFGNTANMLHFPVGIFVTVSLDLYVADSGNNRVQMFRSGELSATTMAGIGSSGTISLNSPTGVVVDDDGYLFIVDYGNHRIVGSDRNGFRCVVGCSGSSGTASDQLNNPNTLSFDSNGNMFVTDRGNNRIQKFRLSSNLCSK